MNLVYLMRKSNKLRLKQFAHNITADHIGYTVEKEEDMKMADTDKLKTEYVETYNRYMTLPDDSKELKTLAKKLQDMEQTLTRRFLFESGYTTEKKGEYCIFVKN